MIVIVDYGVGNLFSLVSSFRSIGVSVAVSSSKEAIASADKIILPGVGAFGDAMEKLKSTGLDEVIKEEVSKGKPLLGICLGMQLLFEESEEFGIHEGLGLIPGRIAPLKGVVPENYKIPQIGWNSLTKKKDSHLLKYVKEGDFVYFVHSFYATDCSDYISSTAEYGIDVTASVEKGNVFGTQFHPEKSGKVGLSILKAFAEEEGI